MTDVVSVLVVEDARVAARAHAAYVNRIRGFRAVAAVGSAAACTRRLAEGGIDLILIDLRLSDGDGLELSARLREQGFVGDVIVMSSALQDDLERLASATVPVRHIMKPFTFGLFKDTLLEYAAGRAADGRGPTASSEEAPETNRRVRSLPRGLRSDTLDAIAGVLRESYAEVPAADGADRSGLSVTSVATAIGASRLTARRYLEYLADAGVLARSLRPRRVGRPEALYRPVARTG